MPESSGASTSEPQSQNRPEKQEDAIAGCPPDAAVP